jgi:hypothetical protein
MKRPIPFALVPAIALLCGLAGCVVEGPPPPQRVVVERPPPPPVYAEPPAAVYVRP